MAEKDKVVLKLEQWPSFCGALDLTESGAALLLDSVRQAMVLDLLEPDTGWLARHDDVDACAVFWRHSTGLVVYPLFICAPEAVEGRPAIWSHKDAFKSGRWPETWLTARRIDPAGWGEKARVFRQARAKKGPATWFEKWQKYTRLAERCLPHLTDEEKSQIGS